MNFYETLGITKEATSHDIKKAYKTLASKYHPDKGGDTAKFQEINTAYQTLTDEQKKAQYDYELANGGRREFRFGGAPGGAPGSGMGEDDIADLLRRQFGFSFGGPGGDPFGAFGQQTRRPQPPRNRDIRIALEMDMVDNLKEQTKTLNITLPGNMRENVELKIPRGVLPGTTIRYPGLGDRSVTGAPRADIYVQFNLRAPENFELYGVDLVTEVTVNCLQAIAGCEKEVTGIDGSVFKVTIPPGTQFGAKFGIPDQGLYSTEHPGRGRLIVAVSIYIPKEMNDADVGIIKGLIESNKFDL